MEQLNKKLPKFPKLMHLEVGEHFDTPCAGFVEKTKLGRYLYRKGAMNNRKFSYVTLNPKTVRITRVS